MIMGLSSKEVTGDGFDWPQQGMVKSGGVEIPQPTVPAQAARPPQQKQRQPATQQQGPPLRCPRCDSTNTKFCYYNNYSRTQPRYFCKACRRHWTEGGTLRNVPVGGGRKAKRPKTSHPSPAADRATAHRRANNATPISVQQPPQIILPPLTFPQDILPPALLQPPSGYADGDYLGSLLFLPSTPQFAGGAAGMVDGGGGGGGGGSYPFSTSPSFHSFLNLAVGEDLAVMGSETAITTATTPPWELLPPPTCSGGGHSGSSITTTSSGLTVLESSSPSSGYWSSCWEDLTSFIAADLEHPAAANAPPPHHH